MFTESISYTAALAAGLLSFFSPCILPLVPAYFTFITGFSLDELTGEKSAGIRKRIIVSTLFYVSGFSFVFIMLGASASFFGDFIHQYKELIRVAGGIAIIVFGLHLTGLFRIRFLDFEKRLHFEKKPLTYLGTFMVGMAFGAGWSPCIGPILGSILIVAGSSETVTQGITLLLVYSAGLAVPFILLSVFIDLIINFIKKVSWTIRYLNVATGVLLVVMGLLLATNRLNFISA